MDANPQPQHPDATAPATRTRGFVRRVWPAAVFLTGMATVVLFGASGSGTMADPIKSVLVGPAAGGGEDVLLPQPIVETTATVVAQRGDLAGDQPGEIVLMEVTAYCPCVQCCGPRASRVTASGLSVDHNGGVFVAADTSLYPFGTRLVVPGYGEADEAVEVIDRGGAIRGNKLDVFYPDHQTALQWGRQILPVRVLPPVLE